MDAHDAQQLMDQFAERTGLNGPGPPRRYLWTDAFAVCNFLGLHRRRRDPRQLELALRLVEQVHRVLGRHRPDDERRGWISGLGEAQGERHPTRGGLRIGKELPERGPREPYADRREWDRDGQYFHYLTKWMHALRRVSEESGEPRPLHWARELAAAAHAAFTHAGPGGSPRMAWKMSIDLSRPLVPSMGQHDPLDALLTFLELQLGVPAAAGGPDLGMAIADAERMCTGASWATDDPLGIGGLLADAVRLASFEQRAGGGRHALLAQLLAESAASLDQFTRGDLLAQPPERRLAFRELGLAIGLRAVDRRRELLSERAGEAGSALERLRRHASLAERIESTWVVPRARASALWREHREINDVMLATSLLPEGFLGD